MNKRRILWLIVGLYLCIAVSGFTIYCITNQLNDVIAYRVDVKAGLRIISWTLFAMIVVLVLLTWGILSTAKKQIISNHNQETIESNLEVNSEEEATEQVIEWRSPQMKNYDPNSRWGKHTIKVSFQRWNYKGFVMFRKVGNCKGLSVLSLDEVDLYYQPLTDNPIGFELLPEDDEGNEWFKMTLTNDEGDELLVEDVWEELGDYIVGLEIVTFVADKE